MSWLISLILAGAVFSSDTTLPVHRNNFSNSEPATIKVISLDETERFEQTYPLNSNGRVSVSNVNGSITIETWERNEVRLEAVKIADDKERLAEVEIQIDARKEHLSVETNYEDWKREPNRNWKNYGKLTVNYRLTVPRNAVLDEIETVNGSVSITNAGNMTKASTVNGQVIAVNLRGAANLSTVNGDVEATFDQLQTANRISLNTVNGRVNLLIPSDANATVKADTVNGQIINDFGLPVRKGEYVGRDLYGKIGSGEVQIRLNSVNGGLFIKRRDDGKSLNPAVNLLPQKNESSEDWDDDADAEAPVSVKKMNKEIRKSVKKSQAEVDAEMKTSQKALEMAQKEIEKIKPELEKINRAEIQAKIDEGMRRQREAMARLADVNFAAAPVIEKKSDVFTVKNTPKVTVDARNCSVSVRGWDKQEVQYSITRISRSRDQKPLAYTADRTDSEVKITVNGAKDAESREFFGDTERTRVEVFVPKKSNLRILTNREIRLENISGDIDLTGGDESINVRDVDGKLNVAAVDGNVRVIGFKGAIAAKTADGNISLEGEFSEIAATTGDGTIILTVPDDVSATVSSNSESVNLENFDESKITTVDTGQNAGKWRLGGGQAEYRLTIGDGQAFIRRMSDLQSKF